ncbi:dynein intermediate chain 2, axonemal [Cimex lectularius]|uniref:Dynein intermediate chain 3, ciliary n=1 Tax=Cimex lectularius TaxID=79782 RepID=A0A8I6TKQ3_CIMLE|nr:dynein intermediate chain 2, axonemal [Cimex lectularius]
MEEGIVVKTPTSEISYSYSKERKHFGGPCRFGDTETELRIDIIPNPDLMEGAQILDVVEKGCQISASLSLHEVNTTRANYVQSGMNHTEGGWPKDLNFMDPEQTIRFRKKVEKDEMYTHGILQLLLPMEHCVHQNNAINIYELYFSEWDEGDTGEESRFRTVNVFRDMCTPKRPVSHISWSPDQGSRLAVTHANLNFQHDLSENLHHSYIWHIENPNKPELVIDAGVPVVCLEYNPRDLNNLVGGLGNGQVAIWDIRRGSQPLDLCDHYHSFRDPVMSVLWINSKSGMEFFSSSTDGQVKWWDVRKLKSPLETLMLDISKGEDQLLSRALGASVLEYEPTIPTRFMVGTEKGIVICGNRKGKTPSEKLGVQYQAHHGPIWSLQRNPAFLKNFLTVGDWTARVWSEDCRESSIIWTSYQKTKLTRGAWSPTKPSVFYTTRVDGTLDVSDILQSQKEACLSIKVCDEPIHGLRCHDNGEVVAVGNDVGTTYIIEISEKLVKASKNDKAYLTAMFERESRREKIIEAKLREQRLKMRAKQEPVGQKSMLPNIPPQLNDEAMEHLTKEFFAKIEQDFHPIEE